MNAVKRFLFNTNSRDFAPLALRLALGIIFIAHGAQKLFGWFGGYGLKATAGFFQENLGLAPGMFWATLAAGGEFFGGVLLLLGLATRFGALNIAVTMVFAWVLAHPTGFFLPAGPEYVIALLAGSITLLFTGGGALSVDSKLQHK